jgi:hypothetical protein
MITGTKYLGFLYLGFLYLGFLYLGYLYLGYLHAAGMYDNQPPRSCHFFEKYFI